MELSVAIDVDISSEGAFQDFDAWVKTQELLPDALFAEDDIMAAAAIQVLKKHGYHVPEDVSVIGFDDIPTCEMLDPPYPQYTASRKKCVLLSVYFSVFFLDIIAPCK